MSNELKAVPKLAISRNIEQPEQYSPDITYSFRYKAKSHRQLPHVVKFSGGRSSGMLLFTLLENGFLRQDRGDVVVFNNTSSEHPETYKFVAECKRRVEVHGIPFFIIQFQTYEDARQGEWRRINTYRLVNERPYDDRDNPDGFHWRGEVFEEMLSNKMYLPNQFSRVCTQSLKLETTRMFLRDWFGSKPSIPRQGHGMSNSLVDVDRTYQLHLRNGGGVPKEILLEKKRFSLDRPPNRPKQNYKDFSAAAGMFENPALKGKVFGKKAHFGKDGIEYTAFIGLRADEHLRVARVESRSSNPHANVGYEGEHVYMPLAAIHIDRSAVNEFWRQQNWGLDLQEDGALSNCVYCFLKGAANLTRIHAQMKAQKSDEVEGFGSIEGTPCDIDWWIDKERKYGRDLDKENREQTSPDAQRFIGFFGATSEFSYETVTAITANNESLDKYANTILPCDCTE